MTGPAALAFDAVSKHFPTRHGLIRAVERVSFTLPPGRTIGLVGESGCGKSTVGKLAIGLLAASEGSIQVAGTDVTAFGRKEWRPLRRSVQMVFQDPFGSLNPRLTVGEILREPLEVHGIGDDASRAASVARLLDLVRLPKDSQLRYPHEFSGGQRQRIGIARAMALDPPAIICDEPVSALDVSVQAQVLNLFVDIQKQLGVAYLFISHDLSVIEYMADDVMVMYMGQVVEVAPFNRIWRGHRHPYTAGLVSAVAHAAPGQRARAIEGEVPSPIRLPSGCRFHTRCPVAEARCRESAPALRKLAEGHQVACHLVEP